MVPAAARGGAGAELCRCGAVRRSAAGGRPSRSSPGPGPGRSSLGASRGAAGPCSAAAAASLPQRAPLPSAAAAGLFSDLYGPGRVPLSSGARSPIAAEPLGTAGFSPQSRRSAPRTRGPTWPRGAARRGTAPVRPRCRGGGGRGAPSEPPPPPPSRPPRARGSELSRERLPPRSALPGGCHSAAATRGRVYMSWPRAALGEQREVGSAPAARFCRPCGAARSGAVGSLLLPPATAAGPPEAPGQGRGRDRAGQGRAGPVVPLRSSPRGSRLFRTHPRGSHLLLPLFCFQAKPPRAAV